MNATSEVAHSRLGRGQAAQQQMRQRAESIAAERMGITEQGAADQAESTEQGAESKATYQLQGGDWQERGTWDGCGANWWHSLI